jgi:GH15 family glucan-1,4-alpha-glucosidase
MRFMEFIEARIRETPPDCPTGPLQIMYGIGGERELKESALNHLSGHSNSKPVWVGNCTHHGDASEFRLANN